MCQIVLLTTIWFKKYGRIEQRRTNCNYTAGLKIDFRITVNDVDYWSGNYLFTKCCPGIIKFSFNSCWLKSPQSQKRTQYAQAQDADKLTSLTKRRENQPICGKKYHAWISFTFYFIFPKIVLSQLNSVFVDNSGTHFIFFSTIVLSRLKQILRRWKVLKMSFSRLPNLWKGRFSRANWVEPKQSRAEQSRAEQSRAEQSRAGSTWEKGEKKGWNPHGPRLKASEARQLWSLSPFACRMSKVWLAAKK